MIDLLNQKRTLIIGIINVSPDSFSGDGIANNLATVIKQAQHMLTDGADILDIGGESTRPGAVAVSETEELHRVIPAIDAIHNELGKDVILSVDTYKAPVARAALMHGAKIINSLSGFTIDPHLAAVLAEYTCPFILYHIKGTPDTMQQGTIEYTDVIEVLSQFFTEQMRIGMSNGMKREQFILDPGIGFGKTIEQNLEIIRRLQEFEKFKLPIAIGVSRKSHIGMLLQNELNLKEIPSATERLEGSLAETAVAIMHGARLIRTHDVKATKKFITVFDTLLKNPHSS